jgi:hypothetical protein
MEIIQGGEAKITRGCPEPTEYVFYMDCNSENMMDCTETFVLVYQKTEIMRIMNILYFRKKRK